jgi:hypothetical protein
MEEEPKPLKSQNSACLDDVFFVDPCSLIE